MEVGFEQKLYIYRKSFNYYNKISLTLTVIKFLFEASSLTAFLFVPLSALSLGAGVIEVIEKSLSITDRKAEYKQAYKFYKQLLNLWKSNSIDDKEVYSREKDFIANMKFFPIEKYIEQTSSNGYEFVVK